MEFDFSTFTGLKGELETKARIELGETPEVKKETLIELKRLIKKVPDLVSLMEDDFLIRFLRWSKFDVQRAFNRLLRYYEVKEKYSKIYTDFLPSEMKETLDMNMLITLPKHPSFGPTVFWGRMGNFDSSKGTLGDVAALALIKGEIDLQIESSQIHGAHIIFDFKGCTLQQLYQLSSLRIAKMYIKYLKECWPCRLKGFHVIYEPLSMHYFCNIISSFLPKKLKRRVHIHGDDVECLHQYIPPEVLPPELGGTAEPINMHKYQSFVLSQEAYIQKLNQYGFINNTIPH